MNCRLIFKKTYRTGMLKFYLVYGWLLNISVKNHFGIFVTIKLKTGP